MMHLDDDTLDSIRKLVEYGAHFDAKTDKEVAKEILAWWADHPMGTRNAELLATVYARLVRAKGGPLTQDDFTEEGGVK